MKWFTIYLVETRFSLQENRNPAYSKAIASEDLSCNKAFVFCRACATQAVNTLLRYAHLATDISKFDEQVLILYHLGWRASTATYFKRSRKSDERDHRSAILLIIELAPW
jgi:hypothetical protein